MQCAADEPGELLFEIQQRGDVKNFDGYQSAEATKAKVAVDVFAVGDRYFRSGDLLRRDADGYLYFLDRVGDTFRWKGENCATVEVANAIAASGLVTGEATVYGVAVPRCDGKAGAAAIAQSSTSIDFAQLYATLQVFVRLWRVFFFFFFFFFFFGFFLNF